MRHLALSVMLVMLLTIVLESSPGGGERRFYEHLFNID